MTAQIVIAGWSHDAATNLTELTMYAPPEVDVVGLVHRALAAESDEWKEGPAGFRKGRWFVDASERPYVYVGHEELPCETWTCRDLDDWDRGTPDAVRAVGASFHAWHAEMYPPAPVEPMGFGAVVKACELMLIRAQIADRDYPWLSVEGVRYQWVEILERGPVTVLSEGVTS